MAESWVRLWAGMTTDPKWQTVARKSGQPRALVIAIFAHLMLEANEADERGSLNAVDVEDVASAMDCDEEAVRAILLAMDGRVIEDGHLSGWGRRQPLREDSGNPQTGALSSTERSRLHREKKRYATQCNARNDDATQCNAPEAEAEAEAEVNPPFDKQQRKAEREEGREDGSVAPLAADPITSRSIELAGLLIQRGAKLTATNPEVRRWAADGVTDGEALQALEIAQQRRETKADPSPIPANYLSPILRDIRSTPPGGGARASPGQPRTLSEGRAAAAKAIFNPGPAEADHGHERRTIDVTPAPQAELGAKALR